MRGLRAAFTLALLLLLLRAARRAAAHEKTLRKIVRNQSKMVQRAFSDGDEARVGPGLHPAHAVKHHKLTFSGVPQMRSLFHRLQRPKISTVLSAMETSRRGPAGGRGPELGAPAALSDRLLTNMYFSSNATRGDQPLQQLAGNELRDYSKNKLKTDDTTEKSYVTAGSSKFFPPPAEEHDLQSVELKSTSKENIIIPPERDGSGESGSLSVKGIVVPSAAAKAPAAPLPPAGADAEDEKADYLIEAAPTAAQAIYSYNVSSDLFMCKPIIETYADIDAQIKFANFDIEPPWKSKKHYWNSIFESRYESLMRNPKWPPLKVIVVGRAHADAVWRRAWEHEHARARRVLANALKKLVLYPQLTFSWGELAHLSRWWAHTNNRSRAAFRKILKSGRFEITTGGWVQPDDATTHLFGLVHQLFEGHQWLQNQLQYRPRTAWLTDGVSHSPTTAYLLAACDLHRLVLANLHFSWQHFLAEYQYSDFVWLQRWDGGGAGPTPLNEALRRIGGAQLPRRAVLAHHLPAAAQHCDPGPEVTAYNVKQQAEALLKRYSQAGTESPHNTVLAPLGAPDGYEAQPEFDRQYNDYRKLADFINLNKDIYKASVEFGTPADYFRAILAQERDYPTLKGDFGTYADLRAGAPAYWAGYYSSRPALKARLRRLHAALRCAELLVAFAVGADALRSHNTTALFDTLSKARESAARLTDRHVAGGTLTAVALKYVQNLISITLKDCWRIQEVAVGAMIARPGGGDPRLRKYVVRDGEEGAGAGRSRPVAPGDRLYVFNPSAHERTEVLQLRAASADIRLTDHNDKDVTIQINPVWRYDAEGFIVISRRQFGVLVPLVTPPLTLQLLRVRRTSTATHAHASVYCAACVLGEPARGEARARFPFTVQPVRAGDVQLENYKHRLVFDELTGFLKTVIEKDSAAEWPVAVDYGALVESSEGSGMFLLTVNASAPLLDALRAYRAGGRAKLTLIVSGAVATKITSVFGRLLHHTVTIYNLLHGPLSKSIHIESKIDYELSPKNRDLDLYLSIQTDIANGDPLQIFTDNNCFQWTGRTLNVSRRIESNVFPTTCMSFVQDGRRRLTLVSAQAHGATALQEGQLAAVLARRVLFDDARGAAEALADGGAATLAHVLLLEPLAAPPHRHLHSLPSATALYLSDALDNPMELFLVDKEHVKLAHYAFLPMVKKSFPCDVSVVTYRVGLASDVGKYTPTEAFLVLHRHGVSCRVQGPAPLHCDGESSFSVDELVRNVKAAHRTNLPGTSHGAPAHRLDLNNFPPMELLTLRIHF